nr:nuclear RNA export factor 1-like isoform X1 [Pocillopora verrucosa]
MAKSLFNKAVEDAALSISLRQDGSRSFKEFDKPDRGRSFRGQPRGRSRGRGRGRGRSSSHHRSDPHPRSHLAGDDDDDIDMDEGSQRSHSRYNPYSRRPPSRRGDRGSSRGDIKSRLGRVPDGATGSQGNKSDWYKVVIPQGKKHDKDWLIKRLQNTCEEAFQPVSFHSFKGESSAFFVEGSKVAEALKRVSHKITVKDGTKLIVSVRPSAPPQNQTSNFPVREVHDGSSRGSDSLDDGTKQVLKDCLSKRYDITTKALDLSDLFHDEVLKLNNIQGILARYWLASGIVKIIGENCPEVQSLDLSNNRLKSLDGFKDLGKETSNLKHIKISNNQLRAVEELDKIKSLSQLQTISLDGNPLCDIFQDKQNSYISAIRSRFPKITTLDGHELPPPIGFDLPSEESLPASKESFFGDLAVKEMVLKFIEQYFKIYDTDNRQGLLQAYHDQAIFSMCVNTEALGKDRGGQRAPSLGDYLKYSRNLKRVADPERRSSFLKHSKLSVVAFLNELPSTKHDLSSFTVDVSLALPSCLSFAVRGLFLENSKTLRSFTRVFIAVPAAGGSALSIINDELHISHASPSQVQGAAVESTIATNSTETLQVVSAIPAFSSATPQQQQMILQFAERSTMNVEWSYKCLSQNNWNFEKAAMAFSSLKVQSISVKFSLAQNHFSFDFLHIVFCNFTLKILQPQLTRWASSLHFDQKIMNKN